MKRYLIPKLLSPVVLVSSCFFVLSCTSLNSNHSEILSESQQARVVQLSAFDIGRRTSHWQINRLNDQSFLAKRDQRSSSDPKGWIQAAFYIGLTRWVDTVGDENLRSHIKTIAANENYQLKLARPRHADDHAIGQTYLWLAEKTGSVEPIMPVKKIFDEILANPPTVSLDMRQDRPAQNGLEGNCQDRWCWSDALFMAPRAWLKLSNITQDPKYFEYADSEFWATTHYLFSEEHKLFYRDSRYFTKPSDNGKPVFWSRGNGWVFAALPMLLEEMPVNHPSRSLYIELYKKHAAGLQRIQNPNGYWPPSLLDPNKVKTPELSGTAFITFGLAWGVNNGILKEDKYRQTVLKGWKAIEQAIEPNGRANWVQQVGKAPDPVKKTDTQFYGVGAVLLAASEMTKWQ